MIPIYRADGFEFIDRTSPRKRTRRHPFGRFQVGMPRRLNLVFLAVALVVLAVFSVGMYLLYQAQMQRNASALLGRALRAEAAKDLDAAEESLVRYLKIRREDGPAWKRYAGIVDQRETDPRQRHRVFLVYDQAVELNLGDAQLARRCADLALELGRYSDARRLLTNLVENVASDAQGQPAASELAELEDLLGQCDRALTRFEEAEKRFDQALQHDPGRVSCFDRLARLLRTDLRRKGAADDKIQEMVAKNPKVGLAYLYRFRYFNEFSRPAAASDLQQALKLAPDDPEVLFTAAVTSEQKPDAAAARAYFEKGWKLDPKNLDLTLGLARLETRERHLDRAEAVLQQSLEANPSHTLTFILAENLIRQDKIEGKDQAALYLARLRNAGLGDTLVRFLEAEILCQRQNWAEAIPKIEMARAVLAAGPQLTVQLELMLAECYDRVGDEEQRLAALRRAAAGDQGPESARIELAQTLARAGKLDQAVTILQPLAVRKPEWRLDLVRLLIQQASRQPRDRRNWQQVEQQLREAEKALPQAAESTALLRVDLLAAQGRLEDARLLLSSVQAKEPRNLRYRLALARLTQRQGQGAAALQILDQTEKDLRPSLDIQLARLDYWGREGGSAAQAAVAKLAGNRQQIPAADRPAFLDRLGSAAIRLGELNLARQYWRELAALQPDNLRVRLGLFDLAARAGDQSDAAGLVDEIRKAEGDEGTTWEFAQAALLIDKVRRGFPEKLDEARALALKISQRRPQWANAFALSGEIAELDGSTDQAIESYLRAVELGYLHPLLIRRLVELLNERNRTDEIDHLAQVLRDQGAALDEITIVKALAAIRNQDFDRGIALARQVFPDSSTDYSDHLTLGRLYMTAGRIDEAGKEFRRAVELGPGVAESWLTYVPYLVQAKQIDQARAAVEAARQALPADRATLTLAQCHLLVGDTKQAEELIQKALNEEGKSADPATLQLAASVTLSQNRAGEVNKYLDKLDQVTDLSPVDKAWVNQTRIALLLNKGRPADQDEALRLVDQNLRNDPNSAQDAGLKATILAARPGRRVEAVTILERLGGANRLGDNERFLLAQLYLRQRDEQKYQDEMHKLLNLKIRNPWHLLHFVNYWIGRNQLDQADRWLAELKKAEPQAPAALELEARLLDLRRRKPELLRLLEARGREVPDQIGHVADLLNRYGFAREAEAAYRAFIARDPRLPERVLLLADFLARHDRVAEAMAVLKKARSTCRPEQVATAAVPVYDAPSADETQRRQVEDWVAQAVRDRPDAVPLATWLGSIWIRQSRFDEAEALLRRLIGGNPDNVAALNNLAWLLALRDAGKAQEALGLIDRAIDVRGPNVALIDTRAVVLIRAGKFDQALRELRDAQKVDPRNQNLALHLAWAYQQKGGGTDQARTALREAEAFGWRPASSDPLERTLMDQLRQDLSHVSQPPGNRS